MVLMIKVLIFISSAEKILCGEGRNVTQPIIKLDYPTSYRPTKECLAFNSK